MNCRVCHTETAFVFSTTVLKKYPVGYYQCPRCSFLQTEDPYWIDEAYQIPINKSDTGVISRNLFYSKIVTTLICLELNDRGQFLDFGGGYGIFTRMMRDIGFDYYWMDPYADNLVATGFEYRSSMDSLELVTSFETFEHFKDPLSEFSRIRSISSNIFISTELLPSPTPTPEHWYYYAPEHGQHISFFSMQTFQYLSELFKMHYNTNGTDLHLLTERKISQAKFNFILRFGKYLYYILKRRVVSRTVADSIKNFSASN